MKIVALAGPGEDAKRSELLKIKSRFSSDAVETVDFKQDGLQKLQNILASVPLFLENSRLIVVENTPDSLNLEQLKAEESCNLLLVTAEPKAGSILEKSLVSQKARVVKFEGDKELSAFPFLDSLIEQKETAFTELAKLQEEYGAMYILTMIYYLLRRNRLPLPASSFTAKKIEQQKRKYNNEDWLKLYRLTLETEFNIKSGLMEENLAMVFLVERWVKGSW